MLSKCNQQFDYRQSAQHRRTANKNPYERFTASELILRDQLAIDRTALANERTFLAYSRTSLALILTGAGCIKFFGSLFSEIAGWVLIVLGLAVVVVGAWRSIIRAKKYHWCRKQPCQ